MASKHRAEIERRTREATDRQDWEAATEVAVRGYGPEVFGFLVHTTSDETLAGDAFSWFCESLLKAIPRFRWEASLRSLCYVLARRGISRAKRGRPNVRETPLTTGKMEHLAQEITTSALPIYRQQMASEVAGLRAALAEEDRVLLTLRVDRELSWKEVAAVMSDEDELDDETLDRHAAALRKRYERAKHQLRELAIARGLRES
ncbi:MAG: sigma-70 family RNA polymerase sigma factor [Myxococcota bacterium]